MILRKMSEEVQKLCRIKNTVERNIWSVNITKTIEANYWTFLCIKKIQYDICKFEKCIYNDDLKVSTNIVFFNA